jgi:hypothetical protein
MCTRFLLLVLFISTAGLVSGDRFDVSRLSWASQVEPGECAFIGNSKQVVVFDPKKAYCQLLQARIVILNFELLVEFERSVADGTNTTADFAEVQPGFTQPGLQVVRDSAYWAQACNTCKYFWRPRRDYCAT